MIITFIHEIDKQITSTRELYNKTKYEIFKKRIQRLQTQKDKILMALKDPDYASP
jgi:hypothetical protein